MEKTIRQRVGVSTSVKGIKTFDCTVEITSDSMTEEEQRAEQLKRSDALVKALDARYPAVQEK